MTRDTEKRPLLLFPLHSCSSFQHPPIHLRCLSSTTLHSRWASYCHNSLTLSLHGPSSLTSYSFTSVHSQTLSFHFPLCFLTPQEVTPIHSHVAHPSARFMDSGPHSLPHSLSFCPFFIFILSNTAPTFTPIPCIPPKHEFKLPAESPSLLAQPHASLSLH